MSNFMPAILANVPDAQCAVNDNTGEIMAWIGPGAQPTDEQLQQWYVNYQEPVTVTDPIEKLRAFLAANPDVKAILQ